MRRARVGPGPFLCFEGLRFSSFQSDTVPGNADVVDVGNIVRHSPVLTRLTRFYVDCHRRTILISGNDKMVTMGPALPRTSHSGQHEADKLPHYTRSTASIQAFHSFRLSMPSIEASQTYFSAASLETLGWLPLWEAFRRSLHSLQSDYPPAATSREPTRGSTCACYLLIGCEFVTTINEPVVMLLRKTEEQCH